MVPYYFGDLKRDSKLENYPCNYIYSIMCNHIYIYVYRYIHTYIHTYKQAYTHQLFSGFEHVLVKFVSPTNDMHDV